MRVRIVAAGWLHGPRVSTGSTTAVCGCAGSVTVDQDRRFLPRVSPEWSTLGRYCGNERQRPFHMSYFNMVSGEYDM